MKKGDFVSIEYVGRLESGEIFDMTDEELAKKEGVHNPKMSYGPVKIIVGAGFVLPGMDKQLEKMKVGEEKEFEIKPEDAFGKRDPELVKVVPKKAFKEKDVEPYQGMVADFSGSRGRVQSVDGGRVRVDFNNPLAGKTLKYRLKIIDKVEKPEDRVSAVFEYFGAGDVDAEIKGREIIVHKMVSPQLKERVGELLTKYMNADKVTFLETYSAKGKESSEKK